MPTRPSPSIGLFSAQLTIHHVDNVRSENRQELPGMKGSACGDEETGTEIVWADYPVLRFRDTIPITLRQHEKDQKKQYLDDYQQIL